MLSAAARRARLARPPPLAWQAQLSLACVLALAVALAVSTAAPARADSVRGDQQWVLNAINLPAAWNVSRGQGVVVAVIDSGVNPGVSDLSGSVIPGPDLTGVGTPPSSPSWGMHGTWMASLVAGHGHNGGGDGVSGAAPLARVLSIRVITDRTDPGYAQYEHEPLSRGQHQLAKAIRYAVSHGAGIISMSLGYSTSSRAVRSALQDALDHNVVVVASSGNSGNAADARGKGYAPISFPADYLGVLGVAAINKAGRPADFSSENLSVQVAAPGVSVPAQGTDGQYWLVSGTSPACALAAGVAALVKSRYPGLSQALVRRAIMSSTRDRPPSGYDDQVGFGTLDAAAALAAAGRLAGQVPRRHDRLSHQLFGGGSAAVPTAPIGPRGAGTLVLLCLLGAGCLALMIAAVRRLAVIRHAPPQPAGSGGWTPADGGAAGTGGWTPAGGGAGAGGGVDGGGMGAGGLGDGAHASAAQGSAVPATRHQPRMRPEDAAPMSVLPRFTWPPGPTGRHAAPSDQHGGKEAGE
jgi:Subtilase family